MTSSSQSSTWKINIHSDRKCEAATDFFADNISEKDACDWEYMIGDLEEIKDDGE